MLKDISRYILEEMAVFIGELFNNYKNNHRDVNELKIEVLKFEMTAIAFWFLQRSAVFPEQLHRMVLDELHNQYFAQLKKSGYDHQKLEIVSGDLNLRYRIYSESFGIDSNLTKVGVKFAEFTASQSNMKIDTNDLVLAVELTKIMIKKTENWRNAIKF